MLVPMNVVMLSGIYLCCLLREYGGEEEGKGKGERLESERCERRHREAGRERRGPVRVVGRGRLAGHGNPGLCPKASY